jgi:thiol-disulfide isomerase/thioredoxin
MMKKWLIFPSCIAILLFMFIFYFYTDDKEYKPIVGAYAPNIKLSTLENKTVNLVPKNNKPTLLVVWNSNCKACLVELPAIQRLYDIYKDRMNFQTVNLLKKDHIANVKLINTKLKAPILLDKNEEFVKLYKIEVIPILYSIDKSGKIVNIYKGLRSQQDIESIIKKDLKV